MDVSRGKFQWGINNSPEDTYWQTFEWIQARLVLLDGEVRDKIPRKPPSGFGAQKKKSAATAAQNGPFNCPPHSFSKEHNTANPASTIGRMMDLQQPKRRRTIHQKRRSGEPTATTGHPANACSSETVVQIPARDNVLAVISLARDYC